MDNGVLYEDDGVSCDTTGLRIARYYRWGAKWIPYGSIRSVWPFRLRRIRGSWRLWGSGDFVHWYNLDLRRPRKTTALELDIGRRVRPVITPDDPGKVETIVATRAQAGRDQSGQGPEGD